MRRKPPDLFHCPRHWLRAKLPLQRGHIDARIEPQAKEPGLLVLPLG